MAFLRWFFEATLQFGSTSLPLREVVGGSLGLLSAILGAKRLVAAWPIGIVADGLLFTVFLGAIFTFGNEESRANFYGQAGRNLLLMVVSLYGWIRWHHHKKNGVTHQAVDPRWTTHKERLYILPSALIFFLFSYVLFSLLGENGSWLVVDTWIFTGTALATWGMSRGFVEFWLVWIAVDAVGVPFALSNGYYPTGVLYGLYLPFVIWGFLSWLKISRQAAKSLQ